MIVASAVAVVLIAGVGAFALTRDSSDEPESVQSSRRSSTTNEGTTTTSTPLPPTTIAAAPATTPPTAPAASGPPYAVGVQRITLQDPSRPTNARGPTPASNSRTLPVAVRYPATGSASGSETEGAPAASGTFPLVVFAHGFDISAADYNEFTRDLAAQGFIVAAPDFPLSSRAFPGPPTQADIDNQARDVSFVIASLASGPGLPPLLSGHVAATEAGVVGHSDGGATVARVASNSCCFDARVGAAVILSGDEGQSGGQWGVAGAPPMLLLQGTNDGINPWSLTQRLYDDAATPKWLVSIAGADHLAPYISGAQEDTIVDLVAGFLRARLQDAARLAQAEALANTGGLALVAAG